MAFESEFAAERAKALEDDLDDILRQMVPLDDVDRILDWVAERLQAADDLYQDHLSRPEPC